MSTLSILSRTRRTTSSCATPWSMSTPAILSRTRRTTSSCATPWMYATVTGVALNLPTERFDSAADERRVRLDFLDEPLARSLQHRCGRGLLHRALFHLAQREHEDRVRPVREKADIALRNLCRRLPEGQGGDVLTKRSHGEQPLPDFVVGKPLRKRVALRERPYDILFQQQFVREAVDIGEERPALAAHDFAQYEVTRPVKEGDQSFFCLLRCHIRIVARFSLFTPRKAKKSAPRKNLPFFMRCGMV